METYTHAGTDWSVEDDYILDLEYNTNKHTVTEIARIQARPPGEIISRLVKLKFISNRTSVRGYLEYKNSDLYKNIVASGKYSKKLDISNEYMTVL